MSTHDLHRILPAADLVTYVRERRHDLVRGVVMITALTTFGTIWDQLGVAGQTLVAAAAAVAAIGFLWQRLVKPVLHTVKDASQAYGTLSSVDEKIDQLQQLVDAGAAEARATAKNLDGRVSLLERRFRDVILSRTAGRRDDDHELPPGL